MIRLLRLLDTLSTAPKNGLGSAELSLVLETPRSSLNNLLRPLTEIGYLTLESGRYKLGPSIFRLAGAIMSVWNFSNMMRPFLKELAVRSRESVYLGVMDHAGKVITCVDAIDSPHSVRYSVTIGAVRPLDCTGAGRVLLAFSDRGWLDDYISTLKPRTARDASAQQGLCKELEQVRKNHISVSIGEVFPEAAAIAAPIFDAGGKIAAAIVISGPTERLCPRIDELTPIIADVAIRASGRKWESPL